MTDWQSDKKIKLSFGLAGSDPFILVGGMLAFLGLVLVFGQVYKTAAVLLFLSSLVLTHRNGIELDPSQKLFRFYTSVLGIKYWHGWISYRVFKEMFIRQKRRTHSLIHIASGLTSYAKEKRYYIELSEGDHFQTVEFAATRSRKRIIKLTRELSKITGIPIVRFNPPTARHRVKTP